MDLIKKLYAGDLRPAENQIRGDESYETLCRQSLEEIEQFTGRLDKDMKREFEQLMEHYLELTYMEKAQTFQDGFRIGAGIMCEVVFPQEQGRG